MILRATKEKKKGQGMRGGMGLLHQLHLFPNQTSKGWEWTSVVVDLHNMNQPLGSISSITRREQGG